MTTEQTAPADSGTEQLSTQEKLESMFDDGEPAVEQTEEQGTEASGTDEQADDQAAEQSIALEQVEFDGKAYQVPPELKSALMRQSDYTQKTQEVAEMRKQATLQQQAWQTEVEIQREIAPDVAQMKGLEAQIDQFKQVDWSQLSTDDLVRTKHALDTLKENRDALRGQIQQKYHQSQAKLKDTQEQLLAAGHQYLQKSIPGWNQETASSLAGYAIESGFSKEETDRLSDPRVVKALWKARQYDLLQSGKAATVKRAADAPPMIKPGASSTPQQNAHMEKMRFAKALKTAETPSQKTKMIQQRLERFF